MLFSPKLLRVKEVTMRIQHAWRDEVERARLSKKPREPTLAWAIWYAYKTQFIWAFVFQLLFCFGQIGQPYLIGELVEHIRTGKGGITYGSGIALAMAASSLACSVLFSAFIFFLRRQGIMVRTAMMMACYERSLALTTASRSTLTVGKTTTLISVDTEKLFLAAQYIGFLWHGPLAAVVVMLLLVREVGWQAALGGMTYICLLIPSQQLLAGRIGKIRREMVKCTDASCARERNSRCHSSH